MVRGSEGTFALVLSKSSVFVRQTCFSKTITVEEEVGSQRAIMLLQKPLSELLLSEIISSQTATMERKGDFFHMPRLNRNEVNLL